MNTQPFPPNSTVVYLCDQAASAPTSIAACKPYAVFVTAPTATRESTLWSYSILAVSAVVVLYFLGLWLVLASTRQSKH